MGIALATTDLGTGRSATAITAGIDHSCALLDDVTVKCWGRNSFGQLGQSQLGHLGDGAGEMGDALPPIDVGTQDAVTAVATGSGSHVRDPRHRRGEVLGRERLRPARPRRHIRPRRRPG